MSSQCLESQWPVQLHNARVLDLKCTSGLEWLYLSTCQAVYEPASYQVTVMPDCMLSGTYIYYSAQRAR